MRVTRDHGAPSVEGKDQVSMVGIDLQLQQQGQACNNDSSCAVIQLRVLTSPLSSCLFLAEQPRGGGT